MRASGAIRLRGRDRPPALARRAARTPAQYPGHPASGPANTPELPDPGRANTSLGAGLLTPWSGRMDWAALLQRVYLYDVLACPCGGARTILADVSDPELVRHILHDLRLPADPPHVARARDPT